MTKSVNRKQSVKLKHRQNNIKQNREQKTPQQQQQNNESWTSL